MVKKNLVNVVKECPLVGAIKSASIVVGLIYSRFIQQHIFYHKLNISQWVEHLKYNKYTYYQQEKGSCIENFKYSFPKATFMLV